ncbi:MBL fold metallo-hydrolase [Streptomyces sp. NPDC048352]|uniref:MBL fold metallo-hydrolase n=1 Tax=Streptomyces sp. NPDC048352 TaxID=3154718 RepID=UPI0034291AAF
MSGLSRRELARGAVGAVALTAWGPALAGRAYAAGDGTSGDGTAGGTADGAGQRRVVARQAGPFEVLALLDAHGPFPGRTRDHFTGAAERDWERAERLDPAAFGPDGTWDLDFRCYAVRRPGGRVTLVDTGIGPVGSPTSRWAPVPGRLPRVLTEAGIGVADVDSVVLTHLHSDHYGWVVGPDGTPLFPGARHVVQHAEVASLDPGDTSLSYVVEPLRAAGLLQEVDGRTRLVGDGRGRGRTVTLVPTPGHTAGHQSVLVEGGSRRVMVTGDVLVHAVQWANPAVAYRFEHDPAAARDTRERLLAEARRHRSLLATAHLNRPFIPAG